MDTDAVFEDRDIVDRYRYRPGYPEMSYRRLIQPGREARSPLGAHRSTGLDWAARILPAQSDRKRGEKPAAPIRKAIEDADELRRQAKQPALDTTDLRPDVAGQKVIEWLGTQAV